MSAASPLIGWVLCVMLDRRSTFPALCHPEPNQAACLRDMRDWLYRGWAWESRSGLDRPIVAFCVPPEMQTP